MLSEEVKVYSNQQILKGGYLYAETVYESMLSCCIVPVGSVSFILR